MPQEVVVPAAHRALPPRRRVPLPVSGVEEKVPA